MELNIQQTRTANFARVKDPEFDKLLKEYRANLNILRMKAIIKYGNRAKEWFKK